MFCPISLNIYDIGEHGFNSCLCLPLPASLLEWRNKFSVLHPILKYWPIIVVQTETYRPIYNTTEKQPYIEQAGVFVVKCVRENICHFHNNYVLRFVIFHVTMVNTPDSYLSLRINAKHG